MAEQLRFPGFPEKPAENYWQYPKICNGWWHLLSGAEQKVLDYLLRHTWGYQKYQGDYISISQFTNGIKNRKTGEIVDMGTGLSHTEVISSLKELENKGFIEKVIRKEGNKKTGKINYYKLKLQPVKKVDTPSKESLEVGCKESLDTINNVTINNRQYISKEIEKPSLSPSPYGNEDINYLLEKFKELTGLQKLDGSEKINRRYCWLCLKKFRNKENIEKLIKIALKDKFHQANLTSFKYLYYNGVKIFNQLKVELENPRLLDLTKLK